MTIAPLRLTIDMNALAANWRWLARMSGPAACGAAVKADGYGTGAAEAVARLAREGCRDFFVATWAEARALIPGLGMGVTLHVLHGLLPGEDAVPGAQPVLNTPEQVARWRAVAGGRPCDLMFDTGMNRLGLSPADATLADGLSVDVAMSHLACADEVGHPANAQQLAAFRALSLPAGVRRSLANSAGICMGTDYSFDLTRPGLALYGGIPRAEAHGHIQPVVRIESAVLQIRHVPAGDMVGYGGTWQAPRDSRIAIVNLGYADGYLRGFSNRGQAFAKGVSCPVAGRVSMDLTAIDITDAPLLAEGDWIEIDFDLARASIQSGLSQYELLTCLSDRYLRCYL